MPALHQQGKAGVSIIDDLTDEVMAILRKEETDIAIFVATRVLIGCLHQAVANGDKDAAKATLDKITDALFDRPH